MQIISYVSQDKFAKIHLPIWQLYLPQAIGQWDVSSPEKIIIITSLCSQQQKNKITKKLLDLNESRFHLKKK